MTPLDVQLKTSGGGPWFRIGFASDLEAAGKLVEELDRRWLEYESAGFPPLHEEDPLNGYEGCDIEARALDGRVWDLSPEGESVIEWELRESK